MMERHLLPRPSATAALAVAAALLLACLPLAASGAQGEGEAMVVVPDSIVTRNVPPIPAADTEALQPYENLRSAFFVDWHPTQRRMLIGTRFADTTQLHEVARPLGARTQITFYDEPVSGGTYRPGAPEQLALSYDAGGSENFQVFLLDRSNGRNRRLSDGTHRYTGLRWAPDGSRLAYTSNARNGADWDVYVYDLEEGERLVAELSGAWFPLEWSRDGKRLLLQNYVSVNESSLAAVDVASGEVTRVTPEAGEGEETVAYLGGAWSGDGGAVYTTSDRDSEFTRLVRIDLASGLATVLSGGSDWDVEGFDVSEDGKLLAYFVNEDGISRLHLLDARTGEERPAPELPPGVATSPDFRPGSHEFSFTLSWARAPWDIYSYDADSGAMDRWTASEVGGLDTDGFALPELVRFPTFDRLPGDDGEGAPRTIPAFVFLPPGEGHTPPYPVYVDIHGGPESQRRPGFLGSYNYLLNELGVALVFPNVRGSTGYGKSFTKMDNGRLREDSVRDVGALLDWIATRDDLDASRVMVGGGSYGGYMVLATSVLYADRIRAAFDVVGISNFVTFLTNTEDYRRDLRRAEYGDERDPEMRTFLEGISPANRVEEIVKPLLVSQGANDPRVPVTESDQIVDALERQETPVWYIVAQDEGHGFRKKVNSDYQRAVWIAFLKRHLLAGAGLEGTSPTGP